MKEVKTRWASVLLATFLIVGMAVVTFVTRYPVMVYFGRLEMPETVGRALRFVPPAVLTAIIVPMMVMPDGEQIALTATNPALFGGAAAALIAWPLISVSQKDAVISLPLYELYPTNPPPIHGPITIPAA